MPGMKAVLALLALAATAAALAGCGSSGDKTLDPAEAQSLKTALAGVQQAVSVGDCVTAQARAQDFIDAVNQLPDTAGAQTKSALRAAGDNLKTLANDPSQCHPAGATGVAGAQTSGADATTTTSSVPPPTSTTTTSTTTTSTTTTSSTPSQGQDGGGQGQDGGSGGPPTDGGTGGTGAGKR
jgi:predicted small lipoprotein YifL